MKLIPKEILCQYNQCDKVYGIYKNIEFMEEEKMTEVAQIGQNDQNWPPKNKKITKNAKNHQKVTKHAKKSPNMPKNY